MVLRIRTDNLEFSPCPANYRAVLSSSLRPPLVKSGSLGFDSIYGQWAARPIQTIRYSPRTVMAERIAIFYLRLATLTDLKP